MIHLIQVNDGPTLAMLACLWRLEETGGRLVACPRGPAGWRVDVAGESLRGWWPPRVGDALFVQGLVDAQGFISARGRAAKEKK